MGNVSYLANPGIQTTLKATDSLGRELPVSETVGAPDPDRQVGLFYFLWLGEHDYNDDDRTGFFIQLEYQLPEVCRNMFSRFHINTVNLCVLF